MKLAFPVTHTVSTVTTYAFVVFLAACGGGGGKPAGDVAQVASNGAGIDTSAGSGGVGNSLGVPSVAVDGTLPDTTGTTGTGNPGTGNPGTGNPGTGNPGTGNPGTGNPGTSNPSAGNPGTSTEVLPDTTGTQNPTPNNNGTVVLSGKFPYLIKGLTYLSGSTTGTTDENGAFKYEQGKSLIFKIGDVAFSTVTPKTCLTPAELMSGVDAHFIATNQPVSAAIQLTRFLQFLDDDRNDTNGININVNMFAFKPVLAEVIKSYSSASFPDEAFLALTGAVPGSSEKAAQLLGETAAACFKGNYIGDYSSNDGTTGKYNITIDPYGRVSGTAAFSMVEWSVTGSVNSDGVVTFTNVSTQGVNMSKNFGVLEGKFDRETNTISIRFVRGSAV
ncbi:MAG: hypothetical protein JWQ23_2243 [Herminiimonas sp.]|nr:hypothetical protein [Herminiimonas sp.]